MPIRRPTSILAGKPPPFNVDAWIEVFDRPSKRMIIDQYRFPSGGGGSPAKLSGTPIGTPGSYGGNPDTELDKCFDGNVDTFFDSPIQEGWVGMDFGTAKVLTEVRIVMRSGHLERLQNTAIQVSNSADFSDATDVYTFAGGTNGTYPAATAYTITGAPSRRYARWANVVFGASWGNAAELEFWGT